MTHAPGLVRVHLLADLPPLIPAVGELRWQEWGDEPGREDPAWWVNVTRQESGRERLPVTWVAVDAHGDAVGAVGLAEFDIDERRDCSPWLVGMIVRAELRSRGIGGVLVAQLEAWASSQGYGQLWVATGGRAVAFYQKCGWVVHEQIQQATGEETTVLTRRL